jgi:hypothetical protein
VIPLERLKKQLHIVMFSGGLSSAILLDHVQRKQGRESALAFFTDTKWEDEDNYRFINHVTLRLNAKLKYVAEGRTPPQVWFDRRMLIRKNIAKCSLVLKTEQTLKFIKTLDKSTEPILYFGIGYEEQHRAVNISYRYAPVECRFPLIDKPITKNGMLWKCQQEWGIKPPRMYELGFTHANCGGRCIKGGHGHFKNLLRVWPDRYAEIEDIERRFRAEIRSDIAILKDRRNKKVRYMTLEEFREAITADNYDCRLFDDDGIPCECMY